MFHAAFSVSVRPEICCYLLQMPKDELLRIKRFLQGCKKSGISMFWAAFEYNEALHFIISSVVWMVGP